MPGLISRYTQWLHGRWPAGRVEKLPVVNGDGSTRIPGLYVSGDLTGIPLLKFSLDTGARVATLIATDSTLRSDGAGDTRLDLVIIGGGTSGMAAAVEARRRGLKFLALESTAPFSTLVNFPRAKPIFTYPREMTPAGSLQVHAKVKEPLVEEMLAQVAAAGIVTRASRAERVERRGDHLLVHLAGEEAIPARRVLVAIGRSGNYRKLGCAGEDLGKVTNRLHDPAEFKGKRALVVGGGDSALETAVALGRAGAKVTLSYRKAEFARPKPDNLAELKELEASGAIEIRLASQVVEIREGEVRLREVAGESSVPNDMVFTLIGREAPLDFFRRSGVPIHGEGSPQGWLALAAFVVFIACLYDWKNTGWLDGLLWSRMGFPGNVPELLAGLGPWWRAALADRSTLVGTLAVSMKSRAFYYTVLYTLMIGAFGWDRVRRRRTPYVRLQTLTLFLVQAIPLFLLPEVILPWMGYQGWFSHGLGKSIADALFESYISPADYAARHWPEWGHPRAYWRAYGLILAWPLNVYNVFTAQPLWWWIGIGFVQTFVVIPLLIVRYGKGAYCGWICSCGALAETMGDRHRTRMFHGPAWNRANMLGQFFLACAGVLLALRVVGWIWPASWPAQHFDLLLEGKNADHALVNPLSYKWFVDILFGGLFGVAFYFKYSGRIWCRFACPLAALMHVYARFSRFAIVPEKKKCISCNVCTSVCHMGIDVMNFANKGLPMIDPECVRCSACVQSCPTGVLQFGRVGTGGNVISLDQLAASPVLMREGNS